MCAWRRTTDSTYRRSQKFTGSPVTPSATARGIALAILECGEDASERKRLAQHLVDDLCRDSGLPRVEIVVADRAQVHEHDGQRLQSKTYGYYRCLIGAGGISKPRIRIYHRTAVRQKVIAPKVFLNTVLHEWVHHFDFAGLRLDRSPHTAGFYARLRELALALDVGFVLPPDAEDPLNTASSGQRAARVRRMPAGRTPEPLRETGSQAPPTPRPAPQPSTDDGDAWQGTLPL